MTAHAARGRVRASAGKAIAIRRLDDPEDARLRLEKAAAYSAYASAYLDPGLRRLAEFYEAESGERSALLMHARGGLGPSTFLLGDATLMPTLLGLHPGPNRALLTCEPEHVDEVLSVCHLWHPQVMVRMQLSRESFVLPASIAPARRLIAADAGDLNRLYALEGEGIHYSGKQVIQGVYYGAHSRGRLVAAAGTHIHSESQAVAVVGNVFTHPDFRGRGLGTAVTAAVSAHLLQTCELVVLSVDAANRVARRLYERLGYRDACRLVEALLTRRGPLSPRPLLRRLVARWRSATPGVEVVGG